MRKNKWIAGLLVALLLMLTAPVLADELEEKQQQLQSIQQQMQEQQNRATQAQRKVNSISGQLEQIQNELDNAQWEYDDIQEKLEATEHQIEVNTELLAKAEKNLTSRTKILHKRIRDIYENGQISYLDVLLGATDFVDFSTRMDVLKRVLNNDVVLMNKIKAERVLIEQKKQELEQDRESIMLLKKQASQRRQLITQRKMDRERVLDVAVNERDTAEAAYQELVETSRRIERMIRRIQSGSSGETIGSGSLMWPTSGPITSPFGWRVHPIFGTSRFHSGIDIGADYGQDVVAADGGVIIYSGWMGGYGKAVIVDHGDGVSTLYAHNSELVVSEGQRVAKGQVISYVGSTGYSTGPHLHFEVRKDGSPTNPLSYLP